MVKLRRKALVQGNTTAPNDTPSERKKFSFFSRKGSKPANIIDIHPPTQLGDDTGGLDVVSYVPTIRRTSSRTLVPSPQEALCDVRAADKDGYYFKGEKQYGELPGGQILKPYKPRGLLFTEQPSDQNPTSNTSIGQRALGRLPAEVWVTISTILSPLDAANLAYSCKTVRYRLGAQPWRALAEPENKEDRQKFLHQMDANLPSHLLCFLCSSYHLRLSPGQERLYPTLVDHPVFTCPNARSLPLPRTRLVHGRDLPYNLVQLALRARFNSPAHGIPLAALSRGWKCRDSEWTHRTVFHIHKGHLLMRVTSTCFATASLTPSQERLLLFSRSEYAPYFSVCDHWQHGELMRLSKCALSHIPKPKQGVVEQLKKGPRIPKQSLRNPDFMPRQCDECKALRRCPQCPTEYLIEVKIVEDRKDLDNRFKHAICVTRWSDLGDGSSPTTSPEWTSCNGRTEDYDSFAAVGNATLCSHFETAVSGHAPGHRALSLWSNGKLSEDVY